jgi:hypothetical protein
MVIICVHHRYFLNLGSPVTISSAPLGRPLLILGDIFMKSYLTFEWGYFLWNDLQVLLTSTTCGQSVIEIYIHIPKIQNF